MKIRKFNDRGFVPHLLLAAFVVVFAAAGTGMLVASHADKLTAAVPKGRCSISKIPHAAQENTTVKPLVTVTNTGKKDFAPHLIIQVGFGTRKEPFVKGSYSLNSIDLANLKPHKSTKQTMSSFQVPARNSNQTIGTYLVQSVSPKFQCSVKFNLPVHKVPPTNL